MKTIWVSTIDNAQKTTKLQQRHKKLPSQKTDISNGKQS